MTLRLTVIGLLVANVFLLGWAMLQPAVLETNEVTDTQPLEQSSELPPIRLAHEAAIQPGGGSQESRQCYTLGPLSSRSAMENIQEVLARSVVQLNWHQTSALVEQGFWVYLEPFGSYSQASEAVAQLVANGVRDYYILPEGPYANAVSVGLYEQRSQAQERLSQIEALGLGWPVMMEMQRKDEPRFWLDFELMPDAELAIEPLLADQEGAQHIEVPCPENEASFPPT